MIEIAKGAEIDERSLVFHASRSSGPGGQNVNKVSTRMTVSFDVSACLTLSDEQKSRILHRLKNRISSEGHLQVSCQDYRSQPANRQAAVERLIDLIRAALAKNLPRKPTKTPYRAKAKRLETKARRSATKRLRSSPNAE
jgi:ribosome-associated protein